MFTGKGGVGKTTTSVATALRRAAEGRTYREVPELSGEMNIDGLLTQVSGYLQ